MELAIRHSESDEIVCSIVKRSRNTSGCPTGYRRRFRNLSRVRQYSLRGLKCKTC
jgi:hypothetical protein